MILYWGSSFSLFFFYITKVCKVYCRHSSTYLLESIPALVSLGYMPDIEVVEFQGVPIRILAGTRSNCVIEESLRKELLRDDEAP